jgi:hypothetical protein
VVARRRFALAIRVKAGIFTGIVSSAAVLVTACSGGSNRAVTSLPPADILSALPGVYRKTSISAEGKTVSCPSGSELLVGTTKGTIQVNGVLVDTCTGDEELILGASTATDGSGRYRLVTQTGTEDGKYYPGSSQIVLVQDRVNGAALPTGTPKHRTVLSATLTTNGLTQIAATAQPISFTLKGATPAFNADGSLNASAITPVTNSDGSVNMVVLTAVNDVAYLNSDLTVSIGPVADPNAIIHPPGIPSVRGTVVTLAKKVFAPDADAPTPAPAP